MISTSRRSFCLAAAAPLLRGQTAAEDPALLSLSEAAARIRDRSLRPSQLVEACLRRIEIYQPKLNAFITVTRELACVRRNSSMPNSAPENCAARCTHSHRSQGQYRHARHSHHRASAALDDHIPTEDAEVARRLAAAGAISSENQPSRVRGGGTNATSYFGPVRNPWALDRNPGGSSGGSGAAVAASLAFAALEPTRAVPFAPPPPTAASRA